MGLKDLHLKFRDLRLRLSLIGDHGGKKSKPGAPAWMMPISHGYHVVDYNRYRSPAGSLHNETHTDSVVVQREQIEELELWFFGVSDARIDDVVTKYLQSHLFDRCSTKSQIRRKTKETMKKAYLRARAKARETKKTDVEKSGDKCSVGSASVMVINGEKLVMANMGDYRAVVCSDGVAYQVNKKHQQSVKRHWSRRLFPARILARNSSGAGGATQSKGLELFVGARKIDSDTEFVIIASSGIWEVMENQEAVSLIRHLEDPQEAAECLAKEALTRMSRSSISCIIIRFD